jgi:hypothetical protein
VRSIRVAAHVHSDWSYDGSWSLRRIATTFRRLGYHAVLLAEHDRTFDAARWDAYRSACHEAGRGVLPLVPGIEYSDPDNVVHIPTWGAAPFLGAGLATGELLTRVRDAGAVAILAHPARRQAGSVFDEAWLPGLYGAELWNRKYDGYAPSQIGSRLLLRHPALVPFVSLDLHTGRQLHPLAMMLDIDDAVNPSAIVDALQRRRARATAFGLSPPRSSESPTWAMLTRLERSRRQVAATARRVPY